MEDGVLVLECIDKDDDPGSEGRFIAHMLSLMQVAHQYVEIRTKRQLTQLIQSTPYSIVHVTTHGSINRTKKFVGLWTHDGALKGNALEDIRDELDGVTVICTACQAADPEFVATFVRITGCKLYIAPVEGPSFANAIFFAHVLYHKHFVLHRSITRAFAQYSGTYKNPHKFVITKRTDVLRKGPKV